MQADTGWAVVHCHACPPDVAEEAIARAGYTVFAPRYRARLAGVRIDATGRRIRPRGLGSIVTRPLFPAYLFVEWRADTRERPIRVVAGGCRIRRYPVDTEGRTPPKLLSVELVDELRARIDAGEFDRIGRLAPLKAKESARMEAARPAPRALAWRHRHGRRLMADPITIPAYAASRGVHRLSVYRWIREGKLSGAALPAPGRIDPELADAQIPDRGPTRAEVAAAGAEDQRAPGAVDRVRQRRGSVLSKDHRGAPSPAAAAGRPRPRLGFVAPAGAVILLRS
jgi:hypothetical protein